MQIVDGLVSSLSGRGWEGGTDSILVVRSKIPKTEIINTHPLVGKIVIKLFKPDGQFAILTYDDIIHRQFVEASLEIICSPPFVGNTIVNLFIRARKSSVVRQIAHFRLHTNARHLVGSLFRHQRANICLSSLLRPVDCIQNSNVALQCSALIFSHLTGKLLIMPIEALCTHPIDSGL